MWSELIVNLISKEAVYDMTMESGYEIWIHWVIYSGIYLLHDDVLEHPDYQIGSCGARKNIAFKNVGHFI